MKKNKIFVSGSRLLKWKNKERLYQAFETAKIQEPELILDDSNTTHGQFMKKINDSYAVILVSLGDIGPNMILDAIRYNKPFILTKENGLNNRIKDISVLVDPENVEDITEKIIWLSQKENYKIMQIKLAQFTLIHTWAEIATEFLSLTPQI